MTPRDPQWQVPEFEAYVFSEKRHQYVLVIPVINEGERIRNQLKNLSTAAFPVDVIVADGGSSDGSLEHKFLCTVCVRAVLVKTGQGRLSAQLRMAYAWALQQGYDGIITIDGNGKDGIEAIPKFIAQLKDGYDYVQGSRYRPGGAAENTPLERTIGNRLIHAPLLSLAGRFWFTDTTNGFRAYSARYLIDPRVQPFRDVFQRYELLFYLTVRARQLGYRVREVAVKRCYPKDGKTPTKIHGLRGKLELLLQAIRAACGRYQPMKGAS
jgi:dolichol-phosphate mannosyltransferase